MSNNSFLNKILLLLEKTRDALIEDLKKEFVSVRMAWDENPNAEEAFMLGNLEHQYSTKVNIIDAVFAKVGYDISHYESLSNLKNLMDSLLRTVDGLTSDTQNLLNDHQNDGNLDGDEVAKFLDSAVPHIQTLLTLVKSIADIEWDKVWVDVAKELEDTMENVKDQFLSKEFARKVLDHIIITLLKNAKDVFHDEIECVRLSVNDSVNNLQNSVNHLKNNAENFEEQITSVIAKADTDIKAQVNTLLRETFDEYLEIRKRLTEQIEDVKEFINNAGENVLSSNIYVKISRAMSITYSILDFLGVIREVKVTLRLPSKLQSLISDAQNLISNNEIGLEKAISDLSSIVSENTISATTKLEELEANAVNGLQTAAKTVADATDKMINGTNNIVGMDQGLQITKEVTGLSVAALGAMQTQLLSLYGPDGNGGMLGDGVNSINSTLNSLSSQLTGIGVEVNKGIEQKCAEINETLETVKNISYPVTIFTISWSSVESLFTKPISHFKNLFPINNVDDIENLMRRFMGIIHCINPDIPDFDSISNMLESLLKRLQEKVIMLINEVKEEANVIWDKFQPIIATIRKVIDMLKEMAQALKDRMYGVLNDVKDEISEVMNGAKQLIAELQEQIKKQAGDILNEAGERKKNIDLENTLNGVFDNFNNINNTIVTDAVKALNEAATSGSSQSQGTVYEVQEGFDSLTETVQRWVKEQRKSIAKINVPRIVNQTIAEPLINCASGILKDTLNLDKVPDFASVFDLMRDIDSLKTLVTKQFVLQQMTVSGNNLSRDIKLSFSDLIDNTQEIKDAWKNANDALNTALNSAPDTNTQIDALTTKVQEIVVPQLQAWAYSVTASMKTVMEPMVWKTRMDNLIAQLQAEFQNDLKNITSLISKDGVNRLIADAGEVKKQLRDNLQINDYVTIVQTALNDVVLPNPELYFSSLRITLTNIVSQLSAALLSSYTNLKNQLNNVLAKTETIATNFVYSLKSVGEGTITNALAQTNEFKNWKEDVQEKVVKEIWKRVRVVKDAVIDIVKRFQELEGDFNDFVEAALDTYSLNDITNNLADSLKNRLEDLALEIWGNLKAEVITPVLTTVKDEIIRRIRELVKQALKDVTNALTKVDKGDVDEALNKLPGIKELKEAINSLADNVEKGIKKISSISEVEEALNSIDGFNVNTPTITDLKQLPVIFERLEKVKNSDSISQSQLKQLKDTIKDLFTLTFTPNVDATIEEIKASKDYLSKPLKDRQQYLLDQIEQKNLPKVTIPADYICWAQSLLQATIDFVQSDRAAVDILNLVIAVYKGIPEKVKEDISDLMPELPKLPDNSFTQMMEKSTCTYDLDNKFCNVTLLNLHTNKEKGGEASLLMQVFAFVGTYNPVTENEEVKVTIKDDEDSGDKKDDKDSGDKNDSAKEEDKGKPALYIMFFMKGKFGETIPTENHEFKFNADIIVGESFENNENGDGKKDGEKDGDENGQQPSERSLGFCLTKKTDDDPCYFHSWASKDSVEASLEATFQRKKEKDGKPNPAKLLNTKYLDLNIGNYPQHAYLLYNYDYPQYVTPLLDKEDKDKDKNEEGEDKKEDGDNNIVKANGFTFGYMAELEDVEIILKLRQNEFFKSILKDDISAKFTVSLLYDYQKGFKFGGGYSFHLDYDCSNLKLGKLQLQNLGIDIGSLKNDWGTLQLGVGSSFSINLDAVAFSFDDLGVNLNLNIVKPDFSLGDWDFGCKFKFPTGVGISIDAPAVKGSGLISYNEATGELIGELELKVINKFGVMAFMMVDLGTVEGHFFSFVGLLSFTFTPGIPLGMGFSLTGIGGCLGLERMIDRKALTTAVRQGTMGSIFFGKDVKKHQAEMKSAAMALFPAKKNQFFLGLLGQISYEPVLKCSFGLMLQLPNPTEVIILGSLEVALEDLDVIRINVQFAGGINFEEGLWFDASLIDSEIVGIKLEGDMAFRLFWGGATKGFLLSVGGFHPNYKPEPGMLVSDMKRLAMKLDYDILKIGLETYLAITSNSFQIGAHLDLKIGWNKFGIFGYAGFDALFQFDPFMFMFDVECGVSVKCGSWTLLSIDLAFSLSGPRPWHVSGSAKFSFLLIPVEVDFNLEWGDKKQTELSNKQIEVLPIFKEQLRNLNNWTIETAQTDDDVVVNLKHEENELLVQPFGTLHFNQSAIPLQLEQPMDLCNNAVPTDYNNLIITGFKLAEKEFKKEDADNLTNDFAPALYYNLSNQEKLHKPSYEKYVSGFSLSASEINSTGNKHQGKVGKCFYKKGSNEAIPGITFIENSNASMANRTLTKKDGKPQHKGPNHPLKTRKAFDRYIKTLDSINENN